jgi:hypothetical protein
MRPTTDQILASLDYSLTEFIIPHVDGDYPTYIAKVMRHVIEHLRVRSRLEGELLAEENREIVALLEGVRVAPSAVRHAVDTALEGLSPDDVEYTPIARLAERNDRLRAAMVQTIETLDADAAAFGDDQSREDLRAGIVAHMAAQVRRDGALAEPTFLSFSPRSAQ